MNTQPGGRLNTAHAVFFLHPFANPRKWALVAPLLQMKRHVQRGEVPWSREYGSWVGRTGPETQVCACNS